MVDEREPVPSFGPVIERQSPGDEFHLDFRTRTGRTVSTVATVQSVEGAESMTLETDEGERYRIVAATGTSRSGFGLTLYEAADGGWEEVRLESFARE